MHIKAVRCACTRASLRRTPRSARRRNTALGEDGGSAARSKDPRPAERGRGRRMEDDGRRASAKPFPSVSASLWVTWLKHVITLSERRAGGLAGPELFGSRGGASGETENSAKRRRRKRSGGERLFKRQPRRDGSEQTGFPAAAERPPSRHRVEAERSSAAGTRLRAAPERSSDRWCCCCARRRACDDDCQLQSPSDVSAEGEKQHASGPLKRLTCSCGSYRAH
ncbi:hypothetical protein AOLI_G00308710 [Acnodon oligacanthus]